MMIIHGIIIILVINIIITLSYYYKKNRRRRLRYDRKKNDVMGVSVCVFYYIKY